MYRASLEKQKMTLQTESERAGQEQFLRRVVALPVVTTALEQMTFLYTHTKESNRLLRYALQASETGVRAAANTAAPVVSKFEKPIEVLNNFANGQLDKLEENYPIITEPTAKVYNATLKPTLDRFIAIKDLGNGKIDEVQGYTSGKIEGVKHVTFRTADGVRQYTIGAVSDRFSRARDYSSVALNQALQSPYGQVVTDGVHRALDATDSYVDYYLPKIDEEAEEEVDGKQEGSPLGRVSSVGSKVYRRLGRRLSTDLKHLQTRSQDSLDKLSFTVNLMEYAKTNMGGIQDRVSNAGSKVKFWWDEITREEETDQNGEKKMSTTTLEQRVLATARHVTLSLKRGLDTVSSRIPTLPSGLQTRLTQAKSYTEDLYKNFSKAKTFEDLPQRVLDQVKGQITHLQETLSTVTSYISSTYSSVVDRLWRPKSGMIPEPLESDDDEGQENRNENTSVMTSEVIPSSNEGQMNSEEDSTLTQ